MSSAARRQTSGETINFYEKPFDVFSNFSAYQIRWEGFTWATSEHLYQAAKFIGASPETVELVRAATSAHDAFKIARAHNSELRPDWGNLTEDGHPFKVGVMRDVCRLKLAQHPHVRDRLEESGDRPIVEDSPKDDFWGRGPNGDGRNELGNVWMDLREELRAGQIPLDGGRPVSTPFLGSLAVALSAPGV